MNTAQLAPCRVRMALSSENKYLCWLHLGSPPGREVTDEEALEYFCESGPPVSVTCVGCTHDERCGASHDDCAEEPTILEVMQEHLKGGCTNK